MNARRSLRLSLGGACIVFLLMGGSSTAATTTVQLRVEGSAGTLFEGPVTSGPETFQTVSSEGPHPCDYAHNVGAAGPEVGNPTTALRDAALASGLEFDAQWFGALEGKPGGDFFVSQVGPDKNESAPPFDSWGLAVNYVPSEVGGCEVAAEPGSEALWAYNFFNLTHLLRIAGPSSAEVGTPFTVHVTDGHGAAPLSGATIGETLAGVTTLLPGAPATDASGNATITLTHPGTVALKASRADSVRSNALAVCLHAAGDGNCGSTPAGVVAGSAAPSPYKGPFALVADVTSVRDGRVYRHGHGPRLLAGTIHAHSAVSSVSLELRRSHRGRCSAYDGARGRFLAARCGSATPFAVSTKASFSYLLPAVLGPGRYVLDVQAGDLAGNTVALARGTSRLVFYVR